MTLKSALLVAALVTPLVAGLVPAASASEAADQSTTVLLTTKSDRGVHSPSVLSIFDRIAAEQDD